MVCFSTKQVAKMLGISTSRLSRAVWDERVIAPPKGPGGVFLWEPGDIERASWVLRRRDASDVLSSGPIKREARYGSGCKQA